MERTFSLEARGSSHHARLDHGNAERGQNQNEANENHRRNRGSDGDKPRRVDGAEQKIGRSKNQVSQRERAAETETVRDRAAKNREKPNHTAKDSSERAGLLCRKIQLFVEIVGERSESAVVGKALENFRDVGDPEGALEAGADFVESLAEAHFFSAWKRSDCNGPKKRSKEVKKTESLPSLDVVRQGGSKIGIPHPGGFLQRVQKLLKEKGLRFSCVQKSAQEVERKGDR